MSNTTHQKGIDIKNNTLGKLLLIPAPTIAALLALTGCERSGSTQNSTGNRNPITANNNSFAKVTELKVCFGDAGKDFTLHLYDNDTSAAIARHMGTADWRLPIYHYDDYDNWEVMQYYDIPSRYDIPSNPETVTSEKAVEVYYSTPNRIVSCSMKTPM